MTIQISEEDAIDRGQPNRKLLDGTHPATIVISESYTSQKGSMTLRVRVVAHPEDKKYAPEGPVLLDAYLPTEITDKVLDLSRMGNYIKACGGKLGVPFEERDQIGKPIQVVTRWEKSRDPAFRDRAEIVGFLPPKAHQKTISLPTLAPAEDPFSGSGPSA